MSWLYNSSANVCPDPPIDNYMIHSAFSVIINVIPFIGPALDSSFTPKPPNHQPELDQAQANLTAVTQSWQTDITAEVVIMDTNFKHLLDVILGNGDGQDYATVTAEYVSQPIAEQTTMNTINLAFLGIMLSLVIAYILMNKKSM
jgi:hypothetical protein